MEIKNLSSVLPKRFLINKYFSDPSFEDGVQILKFCENCLKKYSCKSTQYLMRAMGDNFSFWSDIFVQVEVESKNPLGWKNYYPICFDYQVPQLKLGILEERIGEDAIEKLINEIKEKEINEEF